MADDKNFFVTCENKGSYEIRMDTGRGSEPLPKPVVLVRCDRTDVTDNERGLKMANMICEMFNHLDNDTVDALVTEDMKSRKFATKMRREHSSFVRQPNQK